MSPNIRIFISKNLFPDDSKEIELIKTPGSLKSSDLTITCSELVPIESNDLLFFESKKEVAEGTTLQSSIL